MNPTIPQRIAAMMKFISQLILATLSLSILSHSAVAEDAESPRLADLDRYWNQVSKAVKEGDFAAYTATCHPEAVLVTGTKKTSYPLTQALARWKKEFDDTKSGIRQSEVVFRFVQRLGDATTAHETAIFRYSFREGNSDWKHEYVNLEALLVKKADSWKILMEYQKSAATEAEWNALK